MKSKTAVQLLINEFTAKTIEGRYTTDGTDDVTDIVNKALQLEREQIVNAFSEGTRMKDINDELSAKFNACVYYADTFNDE